MNSKEAESFKLLYKRNYPGNSEICHCCETEKSEVHLIRCQDKNCRLSFCQSCLTRDFKYSRKAIKKLPSANWKCPKCTGKYCYKMNKLINKITGKNYKSNDPSNLDNVTESRHSTKAYKSTKAENCGSKKKKGLYDNPAYDEISFRKKFKAANEVSQDTTAKPIFKIIQFKNIMAEPMNEHEKLSTQDKTSPSLKLPPIEVLTSIRCYDTLKPIPQEFSILYALLNIRFENRKTYYELA